MKLTIKLFFLLLIGTDLYARSFEHPTTWSDPKILNILKAGHIINTELMRNFLKKNNKDINFKNDKVFLVTLEGDIKAVFKAFEKDHQDGAHGEVAAYQASLQLGFPKIPPTVLRKVKDMKGSLQLFVETSVDLGKNTQFNNFIKTVSKDDIANLNLFYFIFGQWDTDPHNVMGYKDSSTSYLIAIDNGDIADTQAVRYGERPFIKILESKVLNTQDADKPFPFDQAKLQHIDKIQETYSTKLPTHLYKRFRGKRINYVIYKNSFWRQFYCFDKKAPIQPFTAYAPADSLKKIKALDRKMIKQIFNVGEKVEFLTDDYIKAILNRRDQVVAYFEKKVK